MRIINIYGLLAFCSIFLLFTSKAEAQIQELSGTIINGITSKPVAGVSIKIKGLSETAISSSDGTYSLSIPDTIEKIEFSEFPGMDIRLPDMDGYNTTRMIKQHKPDLKIIAQTAYASHEERHKAMDAGCSDYISKPTKKDLLIAVVRKHLNL
jgi:CheY-like chemotaxis protein